MRLHLPQRFRCR